MNALQEPWTDRDHVAEWEKRREDALNRTLPEQYWPPKVDYKEVFNDSFRRAVQEGVADEGNGITLTCELPRETVDGGVQVVRLVLQDCGKTIASRSIDLGFVLAASSGQKELGLLPRIVDLVEKCSEFLGVHIKTSLTGHGANLDNAPTATTEAATSVVGDIVRDGADETPGRHRSPVEKSDATGAAAPSRRPHPKPSTESGSDQR